MKFEMNNHEWEILELSKEQIKLIYEKEMNEEELHKLFQIVNKRWNK